MLSNLLLSPPGIFIKNAFSRSFDRVAVVSIILGIVSGVLVVFFNQPLYILLGVVGLLVFVATIYSTQFGLFVLIFISYTRFSDVFTEFHNSPSIAKPFIAVLVVGILLRWVVFRVPPKGWVVPIVLFGLLLLTGLASLIYSPVPDRVFAKLLDNAKDTLIALVIVILLQTSQVYRRSIWVLILSGIFLCTLSVFQYVTGTYDNDYGGFSLSLSHQIIGDYDNFRATGPIGDPNFYAQLVVVIVPLTLERFLHEKHTGMRLLALWGFLMSVMTVIITYSRGGLLSMVVALLIFFWFYPPKRSHVPFIIMGVVAFFLVLPPSYLDRLFTLTDYFGVPSSSRVEELSLQGRLSENLAALEMVKENPLFGVGLNSFSFLFPYYSKGLGLALVATEREAHNLYLETLAETGIVGLTFFMFLLAYCFRVMFKSRVLFLRKGWDDYASMVTGYLAGFSGYFFAAIFIHNGFPRYFFLVLGLALAVRMVAKHAELQDGVMGGG
jgi:putative inorganic carbon (hco3(-)) transporter